MRLIIESNYWMMDGLHDDECHTSGEEEESEGPNSMTRRSPSISFIVSNQGIENPSVFQHII